jgi:hypothetical protein
MSHPMKYSRVATLFAEVEQDSRRATWLHSSLNARAGKFDAIAGLNRKKT